MAAKSESPQQTTQTGTEPSHRKMSSNFVVLLVLVAVIVTETLLAVLLLPNPKKVKASVDQAVQESINKQENVPYKTAPLMEAEIEEREEVDFGEYNFTESNPSDLPFRMSVHFYGLVNKADLEEYNKRYTIHEKRIRHAILIILRSSKQTETTDPSLGTIKNKIKVNVNEILGAPLVKGVVYTDIALQTGG